MRDQKARRRARTNVHLQGELVGIAARSADDFNLSCLVPIDPAASRRRHFVSGRRIEQTPGAVQVCEHSLAMRTEQTEIAVYGREKSVDADVTLREHRMEDAAHPGRRCQRGFVGRQHITRAQQVSMGPEHEQFLRAQHDMPILAAEKREQAPFIVALFMPSGGAEQFHELRLVQIHRVQQRGLGKERRRRMNAACAKRSL